MYAGVGVTLRRAIPVRAMDYDLPVQTLDIAPEVGHSNG